MEIERYTKGIRKVFNSNVLPAGTEFNEIVRIVFKAGYEALVFNGDIYLVLEKDLWRKTPFRIDDFQF